MANDASTPVTESSVKNSKKAPIAQNSAKAQKLLSRTKKGKAAAKPVKKVKKERAESNEHIGERLFAEKASAQTILNTFTKVYKEKKGITDKKFIQARANIYMAIAEKRAAAKKEVKREVKKAS